MVSDWEGALSDAEEALKITPKAISDRVNKSIALKALGKGEKAEEIVRVVLDELGEKPAIPYSRACALAVLGDKEKMLKALKAALEYDSQYRVKAKFDPDFAEYREDPDFQKLVH